MSTVPVRRITINKAGVLFRCRRVAIRRNIRQWEEFPHIQATWEHRTRDHLGQDTREPLTRHLIRIPVPTECNPVILRSVRTITPVECTMASVHPG